MMGRLRLSAVSLSLFALVHVADLAAYQVQVLVSGGYEIVEDSYNVHVSYDPGNDTYSVRYEAHDTYMVGGADHQTRDSIAEVTELYTGLCPYGPGTYAIPSRTIDARGPVYETISVGNSYTISPDELSPVDDSGLDRPEVTQGDDILTSTATSLVNLREQPTALAEYRAESEIRDSVAVVDSFSARAEESPVGDPVLVPSGMLSVSESDLEFTTGAVSIDTRRTHRTVLGVQGSLGPAWWFSWDTRLIFGESRGAVRVAQTARESAHSLRTEDRDVLLRLFEEQRSIIADLMVPVGDGLSEARSTLRALRRSRENYDGPYTTSVFAELDAQIATANRVVREHESVYSQFRRALDAMESAYGDGRSGATGTLAMAASAQLDVADRFESVASTAEMNAARNLRFVPGRRATGRDGTADGGTAGGEAAGNARGASELTAHARGAGNRSVTLLWVDGFPYRYETSDEPASSELRPTGRGPGTLRTCGDETYLLVDDNGREWRYGKSGQLLSVTDSNGNHAILHYGANEQLGRVVDSCGRQISFQRDEMDRVSLVRGPMETEVGYSYDESGRLSAVVDPCGIPVAFEYESLRLSRAAKPDGSERSFRYEQVRGAFRTTAVVDENGNEETFDFAEPRRVLHTNRAGVTTAYETDGRGRITRVIHAERNPGSGPIVESFEYNQEGDLIRFHSGNGAEYTFFHDTEHRLTHIIYPDQTREEWMYGPHGLLVLYADRLGLETRFEYDQWRNLIRIHYWDGTGETRSYCPRGTRQAGSVSVRVDRAGNTIRHFYDSTGLVHSIEDDLGRVAVRGHDLLGRRTFDEDGEGNRTEYLYAADGALKRILGPEELDILFTYDERRDLVRINANGRVSEMGYDGCHNVTSVKNALGATLELDYRGDGHLESLTKRAPGGEALATTRLELDPQGDVTRSIQDETGAATSYERDEIGRIISITDAMGNRRELSYRFDGCIEAVSRFSDGRRVQRSYEYDARGALTASRNELGNLTTWHIDYAARIVTRRDALGNASTTRLGPNGRATRLAYPDGREELLCYDARGRLIEIRSKTDTVALFEYDLADRCVSATDADGHTWRYRYDGRGRRTAIIQPDGSQILRQYGPDGTVLCETDAAERSTTFEFDKLGQITARIGPPPSELRTSYDWSCLGLLAGIEDPAGGRWDLARDPAGRLVEVRDPDGGITAVERNRNGQITAVSDPTGRRTEFTLNGAGNLTLLRRGDWLVARYEYDDAGRVVGIADGTGSTHEFYRDAAGRLIEERDRAGHVVRYRYDDNGRVIAKTLPDGIPLEYGYDKHGQLSRIHLPDGTDLYYERDLSGRITGVTSGEARIDVTWNWQGLPETVRGSGFHQENAYDATGRRTSFSDRYSGRLTAWEYDERGFLRSISDSIFGRVDLARDANGRLRRLSPEHGPDVEITRDAAGRVVATALRYRLGSSVGDVLAGVAHVRDEAGRRLFDVDAEGSITGYRYDEAGRLEAVSYPVSGPSPPAERLRVAGGRRLPDYLQISPEQGALVEAAYRLIRPLRKAPLIALQQVYNESYSYDESGNRLGSAGATTFQHDRSGNLTRISAGGGESAFSYDALDRLVLVRTPESIVHYAYDPLGRRTERILIPGSGPPAATRWVYDALSFDRLSSLQVVSDGPAEGRLMAKEQAPPFGRTSGDLNDESLAEPPGESHSVPATGLLSHVLTVEGLAIASSDGKQTVWYLHDPTGTVIAETGEDMQVETRAFDAFGLPWQDGGLDPRPGFAGALHDPATGLYRFAFRDYSPELGRFLTPDPVRDGINWYAYAGNDPLNRTDPLGLAPRNLTPLQRDAYKRHVSAFAGPAPEIPTYDYGERAGQQWDCADLCVYIASGAVESATGMSDYFTNLTAGGEPLLSIPGIHSGDFADDGNVSYYRNSDGSIDNVFASPNVEAGTIGVFSNHVITVSADRLSATDPIETIQGHATRPTDAPEIGSQQVLDEYIGEFIGWAEINVDPEAVPCPWYFSELAAALKYR